MQLSNKEKYIKQESLRARIRELNSKILTQKGKINKAQELIDTYMEEAFKLDKEFIQL